ncbi:MAG: orotate phosphoribosyltransferase [Clostridia bacterium]|nr:orotate phosphoribosyltransferase [Clostridia bacterium]
MLTPSKKKFIEFMMSADVLRFGQFVTKSGRHTPYFVNTGNYKTGLQSSMLGSFYAELIHETVGDAFDAMFGPAYKGIPLVTACSGALAREYGVDKPFFFNRKEAKDHGEGGVMVGYKLKDGDKVVIIEDVITAGTAMRESLPILAAAANVEVVGVIISVDRTERGKGDKSAIQEIRDEFGIPVYPIVTAREIIDSLYNVEVDGKVYIDDAMKAKMEAYLEQYGVK